MERKKETADMEFSAKAGNGMEQGSSDVERMAGISGHALSGQRWEELRLW